MTDIRCHNPNIAQLFLENQIDIQVLTRQHKLSHDTCDKYSDITLYPNTKKLSTPLISRNKF